LDAPGRGDEETIGDLVQRLVDDARIYARAELDVYAAIAEYRAIRARSALVGLAVGWFFLVTSTTAVVIGAVISLGQRIGAMWAGLAIGIPMALIGYALIHFGWGGLKGLTRDDAEEQALRRGKDAS
jgi:hypothetical protein